MDMNNSKSKNDMSMKKGIHGYRINSKRQKLLNADQFSNDAKLLLLEQCGSLTTHSSNSHVTQADIKEAVDISAATKSFNLVLEEFGPYRFRYTRNGRYLVLGGQMGHLAAVDWVTKKLMFEINVMESIHDTCFLHTEQQIAVAQNKWTYIYDSQGVELHCLKTLHNVCKLDFLPYHFLLCATTENGFLNWIDISVGQEVFQAKSFKGPLHIMAQNPYNAVIACGHSNGTVSWWTPNSKKEVALTLSHTAALTALAFHPYGNYMATAAADKTVKLWDNRKLGKPLSYHKIMKATYNLAVSQMGLIAATVDNNIEIYNNMDKEGESEIYMRNFHLSTTKSLHFCPYEDVLGVSGSNGFSSLLIPGSGDPSFDAMEVNPYMSKKAKREMEVKTLLSKIPYNLIHLDPSSFRKVHLSESDTKPKRSKKLAPKSSKKKILDRFKTKRK